MASIVNVVSTARLSSQFLNLTIISSNCDGVQYDPSRFNAAIIRITNPRATGLLFNSGKLVCIGTKSIEENKKANEKICALLLSSKHKFHVSNLKVHNIVGSANVKAQVNLRHLARMHRNVVQLEPELFPGAKISFPGSKATALVFTSGKIVLTGLKSESDLRRFLKKVIFFVQDAMT